MTGLNVGTIAAVVTLSIDRTRHVMLTCALHAVPRKRFTEIALRKLCNNNMGMVDNALAAHSLVYVALPGIYDTLQCIDQFQILVQGRQVSAAVSGLP